MFDVVGLGCSCLDFFGIVPRLPGLDEEVQMLQSIQQGGGEVATALVTLAKLGAKTTYVGKIGDDFVGHFIRHEFEYYGVDTTYLSVESGVTSLVSMVLVDAATGKRTIIAGTPTVSDLEPGEIPEDVVEEAKVLHLDGASPRAAVAAARRARVAGVSVMFDADVLVSDRDAAELLALTDIVIASRGFAARFTGTDDPEKAVEILSKNGPSTVVLTLGDRGSLCQTHGGPQFPMSAFEVDVIDTTGAGDVFHGAFLYGLLRSWELEKVAEFASAVAAMKCRKLGGRAGIPTLEAAMAFLEERETKFDWGG